MYVESNTLTPLPPQTSALRVDFLFSPLHHPSHVRPGRPTENHDTWRLDDENTESTAHSFLSPYAARHKKLYHIGYKITGFLCKYTRYDINSQ